jgi:hypothetical protein
MVTTIHLQRADMPYYKLFHNGRPCTLALKSVQDKRDGKSELTFDFVPCEPTPADTVAFERELVRMGIRVSDMDVKVRRTLIAVWNARGLVDAEAVHAESADQDQVGVTSAVAAILRSSRA